MLYRYLLKNRPPGIGCFPGCPMDVEGWTPVRIYGKRHYFGRVTYSTPLSDDDLYRYELAKEEDVIRSLELTREEAKMVWAAIGTRREELQAAYDASVKAEHWRDAEALEDIIDPLTAASDRLGDILGNWPDPYGGDNGR